MLSQSIKIATEKEHQKLEKKVIAKLKSINNESSYAEMLKIFYAYFGAIEEAIKPFITSVCFRIIRKGEVPRISNKIF